MSNLHKAVAAALEALEGVLDTYGEPLDLLSISGGAYEALQCRDAITALRAALAEQALDRMADNARELGLTYEPEGEGNLPPPLQKPTVKESLQVPAEVAATLTTTDIAWLATCRMTKLWQELGQMRWAGADEGWDCAIEAVRSRLNDECQSVLDWKAKADQSQATAIQLLRKMQGVNDD